jgi:quinol monooxygenase YgiN
LSTSSLRFGFSDEDHLLKGFGRNAMHFARNVQFQIKPGKETEFDNVFQKEVLPTLRKQNGFQEILVNTKGGRFISLWDNRKSAETYETATYPSILAKLNQFTAGPPQVETYETVAAYATA